MVGIKLFYVESQTLTIFCMNVTGEISCKKFEGKRGSFLQNKINKSCKEEFEQCTRQPDY